MAGLLTTAACVPDPQPPAPTTTTTSTTVPDDPCEGPYLLSGQDITFLVNTYVTEMSFALFVPDERCKEGWILDLVVEGSGEFDDTGGPVGIFGDDNSEASFLCPVVVKARAVNSLRGNGKIYRTPTVVMGCTADGTPIP